MNEQTTPRPGNHTVTYGAERDHLLALLDMHDGTLGDRSVEEAPDPELQRKLAAWRTELIARARMTNGPDLKP